MLPVEFRLQKFSNLKTIKRIQSKNFEIVLKSGNQFKLGVIVSKKVSKKAVDRNRIKRIIHEGVKDIIVNFGKPMIIIVKSNISDLKMSEVKQEIESCLNKV